jgi:hypothetical protein
MRRTSNLLVLITVAAIEFAGPACGTTASLLTQEMNDAGPDAGATCHYNGAAYQAGDIFPSADGCHQCTCMPAGQVACTERACFDSGGPTGDSADVVAAIDSGGSCCPADWSLYSCVYAEGGAGLACHNPTQGCASSTFCGVGCDLVVLGRCGEMDGFDAVMPDGGCSGTPPSNGCGRCDVCIGGNWICGVTHCPPSSPDADSADGAATVTCGAATCAPNEWCDTSPATPTCRCGLVASGSCATGMQCCINPLSGCGPAHCNEFCAVTCRD